MSVENFLAYIFCRVMCVCESAQLVACCLYERKGTGTSRLLGDSMATVGCGKGMEVSLGSIEVSNQKLSMLPLVLVHMQT